MAGSLARYFRFAERSTNLATELRAGLTTFMVMAYIIFVNPIVLAGAAEDDGVHEDDVGHDHERGQARAELGREVRRALREAEVASERSGHGAGRQFTRSDAAELGSSMGPAGPRRPPAPDGALEPRYDGI